MYDNASISRVTDLKKWRCCWIRMDELISSELALNSPIETVNVAYYQTHRCVREQGDHNKLMYSRPIEELELTPTSWDPIFESWGRTVVARIGLQGARLPVSTSVWRYDHGVRTQFRPSAHIRMYIELAVQNRHTKFELRTHNVFLWCSNHHAPIYVTTVETGWVNEIF